MKRKITAGILSVLLTTSLLIPQNFSRADGEIHNFSISSTEGSSSGNEESLNPVVEDLKQQVGSDRNEEDKISLIIEIDPQAVASRHHLTAPNVSELRTESGIQDQLAYAKSAQEHLKDAIDRLGIDYRILEYYDTVLTGMAIEVAYGDAQKIAALPEVKSIEVNRFIPAPEATKQTIFRRRDTSSNSMVKTEDAWSRSYSGKGQLIAIIDSGADPDHEIFQTVDADTLRIKSREEMNSLIAEKEISGGTYFNPKIPFGFNYADRNNTIKEGKQSSHGMHVAGIAAGNSRTLRGVAPDAQLAIMRVFSDSAFFGGTTPIIYNKAIDDAVKLGVDSINMSLGSTGTTDSRLEQTTINALRRAQEAGIVVAIAIGNDGFMGFGAIDAPPSTNPDFGLTNSPGIADLSLAVASVDNMTIKQKGIVLDSDPKQVILYLEAQKSVLPTGKQSFVYVREGHADDFKDANVRGKIALIKRGDKPGSNESLSFGQKIKNAQDHGAIAAIIFNNEEEHSLVSMAWEEQFNITIPSCFISKKDGELLVANQHLTIEVQTEESYVANPNGYRVSNFSSWGVSPEGNLKPDISAPGGQIYSSVNNNAYELMSGTSMASPHVAGGIAVVKEYVEKNFPSVRGTEKHQLIKNILMSSASPYWDQRAKAYASPRAQGAGLMNLNRATQVDVVAIGTNGVSSINLRNIEGNTVTIQGQLKNYSAEQKSFSYYAVLNTDTVKNGKIMLQPRLLKSSEEAKQSVTVAPMSTAEFSVSFTLSAEEIDRLLAEMPNGFFLEGYVFFESANENENISIPYVGFRGIWNSLNVIEESIYDMVAKNQRPMYYERAEILPDPFTHISAKVTGADVVLGKLSDSTFADPKFDKAKIAFSPNNDGKADQIAFVGTFLRNYKDFEMNVYSADDEATPIYRVAQPDDFGVKNYIMFGLTGVTNFNSTKSHWKWSGQSLSDTIMPDGKYILEVQAKADGADQGIKPQVMKYPITIDTVYPRIVESRYDQASGVYTLSKVEESGSGIRSREIIIGETSYTPDAQGNFNLPQGTDPSTAKIKISDHAYNIIELPLNSSIRSGNEKTIIVRPIISTGAVSSDKFKWTVMDSEGKEADPYNLKVGSYTLMISDVQEPYALAGSPVIPFEIKESDRDKIIDVSFVYKNKTYVTVGVNKPRDVSMKVFLIDANTGEEYEMSLKGNTQYEAQVPIGEYKAVIRDLDEAYFALINPVDIEVNKHGVATINPRITVKKKTMENVPVVIERGDYKGDLTVLFRGKDAFRTTYQVDIKANEDSVSISLPLALEFDVYVSNIENNSHGMNALSYTALMPAKEVRISLIKGAPIIKVPVEKSALRILINKAKRLVESNYEPNSWGAFELALDKAERVNGQLEVSQAEVDAALRGLQDAMDKLIGKAAANKTALQEKIDEAIAVYNSLDENYDPKSKEFLQISIQAARYVMDSDDPQLNTESHIRSMIDLLQRAIKNVRRIDGKVDKSHLGALIKQAEELIADEERYTVESINNLKTILAQAKESFEDNEASKNEIDSIVADLERYIGFVESRADKTQLREEIKISEALDLRQYTLTGKSEFRTALYRAKDVEANKRAMQNEVDTAKEELKRRREALIPSSTPGAETHSLPWEIKNPSSTELSEVNAFIGDKALVEKTATGYRYTISFKSVSFEMNGIPFEANITKMNIVTPQGIRPVQGQEANDMIVFSFESNELIRTQAAQLIVDIYEELGAEPVEASIEFDWSGISMP